MAKYTESKNKPQDAKAMKGMTPKEKAEYRKKDDAAHKKNPPKTMKEDMKHDKKIRAEIMSKRKK